jgi:predicted AlkP superfamily pyrophosphatase or phosphodiesterase
MAMVREKRPAVALISIDGLPAQALDDPAIRLPHLRGLAARGIQATGLRPVFPSVTWPCHTTFVTGVSPARHGVLGNHVLDRRTGAVVSHYGDRTGAAVRAETLWDRAATAGLRAAAVCWPKTRGAAGLADCIPEFYDQPLFEAHASRPLWTELRDAGLPVDRYGAWSAAHPLGPLQDWLSLEAAAWLLRRRPPDLLLLHFLVADSFQHDYGPASPEAHWALQYVDGLVGQLLDVLDETGRAAVTDVVVVGDHGFAEVRALALPNAALHGTGVLRLDGAGQLLDHDARVVANGGAAHVYVAPGPRREATLGRIREILGATPGVAGVLGPEVYPDLGLPALADDPTQGDLMLTAADGWHFGDQATPEAAAQAPQYRGSHGHLPDDPRLLAGLVAAGPRIAAGRRIGEASHLDVAPTVAALLGLTLPTAERAPLQALLA